MKANGPQSFRTNAFPWRMATGLVVLCVLAWWWPGTKPNAVLGRLSYGQFYLAVALTAATIFWFMVFALPEKRRRFVGFRLGAVGFSLLVVLLGLEAVAWLMPVRSQMDNPWYLLPGLGGLSESVELPYARPAHISWSGLSRGDLALANDDDDPHARPVTFQTDQDGFRNSKDLEQADLITIGDSFTEAGNVAEEQTFAFLVAQKLGVSGRNLGRSGYSTPTEFIVFEKTGLPCRPKFVAWQVTESNDLSDVDDYERWQQLGRPNYFDFSAKDKPSRRKAWQRRSLTYQLFDRLRTRDLNPWPFTGFFKTADATEEMVRFRSAMGLGSPALGHPAWEGFSKPLTDAAALCRSNQINFVLVHIPDKFRVLGPYTRFAPEIAAESSRFPGLLVETSMGVCLRQFCEARQITYVDATEALQQEAAHGKLVYQAFDTHLSPLGHQIVADLIVAALVRAKE